MPPSVCFAANALAFLDAPSGLGRSFWLTAQLLAHHGWRVHLLYCNAVARKAAESVRRRLDEAGVTFSSLEDHPLPAYLRTELVHGVNPDLKRSEHVRRALEQLHADKRFDLIEFADRGGCGFRSVQAHRAGTTFRDVRLLVRLHGCSAWLREANHRWLNDPEDLRSDYAERYAFENADVQMAPCAAALDWARAAGWRVREEAVVLRNAFPERAKDKPAPAGSVAEVVFFGRMEVRKGFDLFLDLLEDLPPDLPVTFLGADAELPDGVPASVAVRRRLTNRPYTLLTGLDTEQALAYLRAPGRLAVMPSLAETVPYSLIECATQGVPFLASAVGGVAELFGEDVRRHLLFAPTAKDLRRALREYREATPAERTAWQRAASGAVDSEANDRRVVEQYGELADWVGSGSVWEGEAPAEPGASGSAGASPSQPEPPLKGLLQDKPLPRVSVVVTHYNLGDFLPETLASLAAQDYRNLEVIVVDDGSTCKRSHKVLKEQENRYPQFRFVEQPNAGCGAARNRGLAEASGDYIVFMDADNLALPHMISTMATAMQRNPEISAFSCYLLAFHSLDEIQQERFAYLTAFAGGPHVLACIENIYGDTNAIYRVAALRSLGGVEVDRSTPWEDWITFVRLAAAGHRLDVIPECLFHYRLRDDGRSLAMNRGRGDQYPLMQHLLRKCFAQGPFATPLDQAQLWTALVSFHARSKRPRPFLYRALDSLYNGMKKIPFLHRGLKSVYNLLRGLRHRSA